MFRAGANAIVIGDYLTTSGIAPKKDQLMLEKLGYEVATSCDSH
jgi:biotin synthase